MRSARHRSHQSGIDSRSDLTYMRNMGVNVLIMSAQKSSVPLARLKLLEPESAMSFSSAPSFSDKIVIIGDLTLSALPTVGFTASTTGQHNFINHTRGGCLINSYKFHLQEYSPGIKFTKQKYKNTNEAYVFAIYMTTMN